jgi:hypothetical protein
MVDALLERAAVAIEEGHDAAHRLTLNAAAIRRRVALLRVLIDAPMWSGPWLAAWDRLNEPT